MPSFPFFSVMIPGKDKVCEDDNNKDNLDNNKDNNILWCHFFKYLIVNVL